MSVIENYIDYAEYSTYIWKDIKLNNKEIPLILLGMNGLYIFSYNTNEKDNRTILKELKYRLHIEDRDLFYFIISDEEDEGYFYDYETDSFKKYDEIYEAFVNCYDNHLIYQADLNNMIFENNLSYLEDIHYKTSLSPEDEENAYITPIIGEHQREQIADKLDMIKNLPEEKGRYLYYSDGTIKTKRIITKDINFKGIGALSTYIEDGEKIYDCIDTEPDKYFYYTLFGGWFGLHKFMSKNILYGMLYLLTFGCCGVFWIYDLLSIITGNYYITEIQEINNDLVKEKYYIKPLEHKWKYLIFTLIALVIAVLFVRYCYPGLLQSITSTIAQFLSQNNTVQNSITNIMQ